MAAVTKNYDVTIETHHLTDRSTDKLGKLAYVTLSEEFIIHSNDYLVPFHALDNAVVVTSVDRPPRIYGADNVSVTEGSTFNPMDGVSALDKDGNLVPVTYTGTVDTTTPGDYWLVYMATDSSGLTATTRRRVRVVALDAPYFTGIRNINVLQGNIINLTAGVKAWLGATEITYTYTPTSIDMCDVGVHTVTYTATGNGKTTVEQRTVTIRQADPPTISGNTPLAVYVNEDFDPLEGLTAKDANGNDVPVELVDNIFTLTKTYDGANHQANYLAMTEVPLRPLLKGDRWRFDGWYDNSAMVGTPLTEVTMASNKQVWGKFVQLYAYGKFDSTTKTLTIFVDEDGKYQDGQVIGNVTYFKYIENATADFSSVASQVEAVEIKDVVHPDTMADWFKDFTNCLTIRGLWRIDTSRCVAFTNMFKGCENVISKLDLTMWDTRNVVSMQSMFEGSGFRSVDISTWTQTSLRNVQEMFKDCISLTTIYASDAFDLSTSTTLGSWTDMFLGCTNLIGGNGTAYDASRVTGAYAKIDRTGRPGYFTER